MPSAPPAPLDVWPHGTGWVPTPSTARLPRQHGEAQRCPPPPGVLCIYLGLGRGPGDGEAGGKGAGLGTMGLISPSLPFAFFMMRSCPLETRTFFCMLNSQLLRIYSWRCRAHLLTAVPLPAAPAQPSTGQGALTDVFICDGTSALSCWPGLRGPSLHIPMQQQAGPPSRAPMLP